MILRLGDALEQLQQVEADSARCCVTSPPYWGLRDYGHERQIGKEDSPDRYVERLVGVFQAVRRALTEDGTLWLNLGDSYAGARGGSQGQSGQCADRSAATQGVRTRERTLAGAGLKHKDLVGIPWRVALALQADGWWLRSDIIWAKPSCMPESTTDRPTRSHEYVFLLAKSRRYFYDAAAIAEPSVSTAPSGNKERQSRGDAGGIDDNRHQKTHVPWSDVGGTRNARSVWTIATTPYKGAHFATFPEELPRRCIRAGSAPGDLVIDPFAGSGTTGAVAVKEGRRFLGIELNPEYLALAERRLRVQRPLPLETA